ncbi:MTAP family purine nucleoside phosphorylase [Methanosphaerula subterraneus]|uniref:MTAP family purine nucleoside phosphorylase n=1 Tax=Methanosphaerula subterraneus TaxID=3350244 RepID=UPI003F8280A0
MLGIIGGTSLLFCDLPPLEKEAVATPYGTAEVHTGEVALLLRHQFQRPPHRINHQANLAALAILGVDQVVLVGSAGSLKRSIPPDSIVVPDDYLSVAPVPTIHDHAIEHICPGFSRSIRRELVLCDDAMIEGGTYVQTSGPRIETRAEVQSLAAMGDLVGMTIASEATIAAELGIACAAVCTVDNFAQGLCAEEVTYEMILASAEANRKRTQALIQAIVTTMG